jgi:hypothetical protein
MPLYFKEPEDWGLAHILRRERVQLVPVLWAEAATRLPLRYGILGDVNFNLHNSVNV